MDRTIHILGGGVTGSALSLFLAKKGFNVHLYEKGNCLGGLSRSIWIDEFNCWNDIGPHIFHSPDDEITDLWKKLFNDLFQEGDYYSAVIKGKDFNIFHPYPISLEGVNKLLNIDTSKIKTEGISKKEQATASNFREMMIAKLGNEIEKMYFRDYPEKLWGIPTNIMRSEWAPKRISIRENIETFFHGQFVATSKKGAGQVYYRIADLIKEYSGKIHFNSTISDIKLTHNRIKSFFVNGKEILIDNDIVVSTIPVTLTAKILGLSMNLNYRGIKITNWITSKRNIFPSDYGWLYFDDNKIPFTRLSDYTRMSPQSISSERGIITAECPFNSNEKCYNDKNDHIIKVRSHLENLPWLKGKIVNCSSYFSEPYVYPIREEGYENELNLFNSAIAKIQNFWSIGAAGAFEYSDSQILFRKAKDFADDLESDLIESTCRLISRSDNVYKNDNLPTAYSLISNANLDKKVVCISEIGINHNGSIDLAKKLIEASKTSGADYVKFQLYDPEKRASGNKRDAFYSERADGEGENLVQLFDTCHLSFDDLCSLKEYSDKVGIEMFLSAFDSRSVFEASKLNPRLIKISSMDLTNIEVWEAASKYFNKIIASTGMSSIFEVNRSYDYAKNKNSESEIILLHCVSSYPMPIAEASLGRMSKLREICKCVGYSDHSTTIEIPYTAALMGAEYIEKHFTLNKGLNGPDHIHSATPNEMKRLINLIKSIPEVISYNTVDISKIQKEEMMKQKKGYSYKTDLIKGHILEKSDMLLSAPCLGSDTFECYKLIGSELKADVSKSEPICFSDF